MLPYNPYYMFIVLLLPFFGGHIEYSLQPTLHVYRRGGFHIRPFLFAKSFPLHGLEQLQNIHQNSKPEQENQSRKMNHRFHFAIHGLLSDPFDDTENHLTSIERRHR